MADSNQIIGATIQVDAGNSNANVKELNKNLGDVRSGLKDTGATATATGEQVKGATGNFKNLTEQMSAMPGPLGAATEGAGRLSTMLKALASNPLVLALTLIVGALALLYKAFTNVFEGAEKVEQIFAGVKAAAQALFDDLGHIGKAIADFFTFDFSGAADEISQVVSDVGKAYTAMSKLTDQAQKLHQEQLKQDLATAERQKQLAVLREQATEEVDPAKRKAAGEQLLKLSQEDADKRVDLAKRTTDNLIAQKTLEKDGDLKNQDEINEARIKQINVETDAANELRRIGKQITLADKQELADRKAAHEKEVAEAKARRQELVDFTNKLSKIHQDTTLAGITDSYAKEKQQLENKIADDKRTNDVAFQDKKITRAQYDQLNLALDDQAAVSRAALTDKHNKDVADKEQKFQEELLELTTKIRLDGITNAREAESVKLEIEHQKALQKAIVEYKDNQTKFQAQKTLIDQDFKNQRDKLEAKNKADDDKKKLDDAVAKSKLALTDPKSSLKDKQKALDAEQAQIQASYDNKEITLKQYTDFVRQDAEEQKQIDKDVAQNRQKTFDIIVQGLDFVANAVGKSTAAGKAAAIASTIISTYEAAWKIFAAAAENPTTIPFPAYPFIQAALAIGAGLENVAKIAAVSTPGGGSSASVPTAGSALTAAAAPIAPTRASTSINQESINSIGNATSGRTYVLDADVQNNADRNARLNRAARLGS